MCLRQIPAGIYLAFSCLLLLMPAHAAPYGPDGMPTEFTQPDGTKLNLRVFGDEFYGRTETEDGYTVVFNPETNGYDLATVSNDGKELVSTKVKAGKGNPQALGLAKRLDINPESRRAKARAKFEEWDKVTGNSKRWAEIKAAMEAEDAKKLAGPQMQGDASSGGTVDGGPSQSPPSFTTTGTKVGLTLLIDFPDDVATVSQATINDFCNGDNYTGSGNNGSVKKYFQDNSSGLLTYTNVVTAYVRMAQPKSYYNNTAVDNGVCGRLLINDAIAILKALPNYTTEILPSFSNLTVSGGDVVAFNVFFAGGNSGKWSFGLWPHSWTLNSELSLGDGKSLWKYQLTNIGGAPSIGTFCHENGHMLCGYPDLYDYDYDSKGGAGGFCLMGTGGNGTNPVMTCAYLRRASGWTSVTELTSSSTLTGSLTATVGHADFNKIYRYVNPAVSTEYFLIENRQKTGRDNNIGGSGIAIWHVDQLGNRDNQGLAANTTHANFECSLIQADNLWHFQTNTNAGDSKDLYYLGNTAAGYTNTFADNTAPDANWWSGTPSGLRLYDFSASGAAMTFKVGLPPNSVNVLTPNGGDKVYLGSSREIRWLANFTGDVNIELFKGGVLHSTLATGTANDGLSMWSVSAGLPPASDYSIKISSYDNPAYTDSSDANFTIMPQPTLAESLDTTGLTWTLSGNANWFAQSATTHDGVDAAQSGNVGNLQNSYMETTVTGPGTVTFWWKVSSESTYDFLRFYINGAEQSGRISGETNWAQKTVSIASGTQTLKWGFTKDDSVESGADCGWVDQVVWTPTSTAEIAVEQPAGTDLTDGSATVNCGTATVGSPASPTTFTIKNTGASNLTGLALSKSGTHSADFTLGALGATTVAPGASTTFNVTFTPGAAGNRTAAIQIASNDANENPFDINLTGTGVTVGTLVVTPAGNVTSSGSFGGPFSPSVQQYTLSNPGTTSINWTAAKTASWVSLSATSGTLAQGASTTVTASINSNANTLNVGSYNDTVVFTNTTNSEGNTSRGVALTVNPYAATVTLGNLSHAYDGAQKSVTVTTVPDGLAYTVTYDGSDLQPTNAGTYRVVATVTEPNYSGSASGTLAIAKVAQTITFSPLGQVLDTAAAFDLTATASSALAVTYTSSNPSVATVSGSTVTIVGVGTTTITASQPGNVNYLAADSIPQILEVVRANPYAVHGGPYKVIIGQSLSLNGSASEPSDGENLTAYDWDLNNDGNFSDATGANPTAISSATLMTTWGMTQGLNPIQLKITDSSAKTVTVSTTVEIVAALTWDANGTTAGQTNGAGVWLAAGKWWDGTTNTNWVSGSNADFGGPATAGGAVTLASPTSVGTIKFNQFTGNYDLGSAGQNLTINYGINKTSTSATVVFYSPIVLGAAQTWTNEAGSLSLGRNGVGVSLDTGGNLLTIDGSGSTFLKWGVISGSGGITKNGTGYLELGGQYTGAIHTYTGTTTLNGGLTKIVTDVSTSAGNLGTGNLTLNGGVLEYYVDGTFTRTLGSGAGQVQILGGASGFGCGRTGNYTLNNSASFEVVWGSTYFNPSALVLNASSSVGTSTFANKIDLNGANRTIQVSGGRAVLSGIIRNGTGTAGLTKTGNNMLNITAATSSWNGPTTVSGGILDLGPMTNANIGGGSGRNISIAAGAGIRFNTLSNTFLNRIVETADEIAVMTGTTSNNLDFSGATGANLPNAFLGTWSSNGAKAEISGTITAASDAYRLGTKGSSGLLGIVGTNKLTGARSLIVGQTGASGVRVELAGANDFTGSTEIRTGARLTLGNNLALQNSPLNLGSTGGTFSLSDGLNAGRITGGVAAPSPTFGGLIGSRNLLAAFSGTSGGNNESVLAATAVTGFTLNPTDGVSCMYSGAIADFATGTILTKSGLGTQILTGANTYTGTTTVSAGRLLINGSLSDVAAALNVNSGATLGGTGTIGRNVTVADGGKLEFNISTDAATHNGLEISAGRDFTFSGASTLTITSSADASAGTYTLVTGGNAITYSSLPTLVLPNGWTGIVGVSGNSLLLTIYTGSGAPVTLTYDANGASSGTAPVDNGPYTSGSTVTVLGNTGGLVKTGYTFAGWNTAANGSGMAYAPGATFTIPVNTTLYAQWTANAYTITFNANGGGTPSPTAKSVSYGSTYGTLATVTRTGYTFNGWFTAASGGTQVTAATTVTITADQTLYAQWSASSYTVAFDANGGGTPSPASILVTYGSAYGTLATVTRTGYTFNGWFTATSGGTQVTSATTVAITANQTLYAQWTANTYAVTFNANGGGTPSPTGKTVTYDATYGTLATVSRTGYSLVGWFTAASGGTLVTSATTVAITANQTLYAQWAADTYTVTFDANGGDTPSPASKSVTYGSTYGTLATTSRAGNSFNGWFTAVSGGTQVTSATTVAITADQTLYAQWTSLAPEINVAVAGSPVADGGYHAVTGTTASTGTPLTFAIANSGQSELTLGSAIQSAASNCSVVIDTQPGTSVAASSSASLVVTVTPSTSGAWSFNLSISNNDSDENPYNWTVHGVTGGFATTTFNATADTYINAASVAANYGTAGAFSIWNRSQQSNLRYGFLKFDLSSISAGATVTSATLDLVQDNTVSNSVDIYAATGTWTETGATWNNSSTLVGATLFGTATSPGTVGGAMPGIVMNADGLAAVNNWVTTPAGNNGFSIKTASGGNAGNIDLRSRESASVPKLTVSYTSGSQAPEMRVAHADAVVSDEGSDTVSGTIPGVGTQHSYVISNLGNSNLILTTPVTATATSNCSITVNTQPSSPIAPSTETIMVVTVTPSSAGTWSATLAITNNDADESPYNWTISGATADAVAVTFDRQGGTGGDNGVAATTGQPMPAATAPTRAGYTFGGYYTATNGGGTQYYTDAMVSSRNWDLAVATTLYARWIANTYTVSFDKQGGTGGSANVSATYGSAMPTADAPTRTGYIFGGYYAASNGSGTQYYTDAMASAANWDLASNTTLYAKWTAISYAVTLNSQSGTGGSASVLAVYGSPMPAATAPALIGYSFGGYYTAIDGGGTQYYTEAMASARNWDLLVPTTLYAKWTASICDVTLDAQGGAGGSASVMATYNAAMPAATAPARTGYTFGGYYTGTNGGGTQYYTNTMASVRVWNIAAAATTLYAKWTVNSYTITLDTQGGAGGSASVIAVYDSAMPTATAPSRPGYTFGGYYTANNGSGLQYYDAAMASARTWDIATATTLYAKWTANSCKVTFDANGGTTAVPVEMTVTYASPYGILATTDRAGYSFTGWFTAATGGTSVTAATIVSATADHTLYAQWNALPVANAGNDQLVSLSGGAWSPADVGALAWYDASDSATITQTSGAVSQLSDKVGTAHMVQATSGKRPTSGVVSNQINGLNTIAFDGSDDALKTASNPFGNSISNAMLMGVFNVGTVNTQCTLFSLSSSTTTRWQSHAPWSDGTLYFDCGGASGANRLSKTSGFAANQNKLLGFYCSITDSLQQVWVDGTNVVSDATGHTVTTSGGIALGHDGTSSYDNCRMGEVVIINGAVSATNREKLEGYLAHKWGMAGSLPTGHPYRSQSPSNISAVANLDGTVSDPNGDPLTTTWTLVSGPGSVVFGNANAVDTTAAFTVAGTYILRLTATDSGASVTDDVVITVYTAGSLDHFAISTITSPQPMGVAINGITITAQDVGNQTATSFTGTVTFGGTAGVTGTSANFVAGVLSGVSITPASIGANRTFTVSDGAGHTGTATFTVASIYDVWAGGTHTNPFGDTTPGSDPDGDTLTNLQEFAFGTDPTSSASGSITYTPGGNVTNPGLPVAQNVAVGSGVDYRAVFGRRKNYLAAGLNYSVQFSADMTNWTTSTEIPTVLTGSGSTGDIEAVSVPYPLFIPVETGFKKPNFFRVGVSSN